ncbi:hypothetical protein B0H16DRAFT_1338536, partial [Mycena metata]
QPRLRAKKRTEKQKKRDKFTAIEKVLTEYPFKNVGELLLTLFHNPDRDEPHPRGKKHSRSVARFLRGRTKIKMSHVFPLIYRHKASYPARKSVDAHEQKQMFATTGPVDQSNHARPYLSTWATRLVACEGRKQVGRATRDDPDDPNRRVQLRAQTNGRRANAHVVTWTELLSNFNLKWIASKYCIRLPLVWFCTEFWAAPMSKDVVFVRKRRPHPIIQVGAIASFIVSRNRYANGDLALILGIWQFAVKAHVDLKRVYSRFGYSVSDTTSRNALNTMSTAGFVELKETVQEATESGETKHALLLDNCQEFCEVYEQGIGRQSELKVGTAGTHITLDDCAPGAFAAKPYYERVAKQDPRVIAPCVKTDILHEDIDWPHLRVVIPLNWARTLAEYIPELHHLLPEINTMFRTEPVAKRRMREDRKTISRPLSTNSERSTELQGMFRAVGDFDGQMGINSEDPGDLLSWTRGDGASYANVLNLTEVCMPTGTFKNKIATPGIWHTGATDLNSTSANHYGPATSSDPSSLSKCSNIAGLKRPSNTSSCDYYPTVRNLTLIWKAGVLNCWRIHFETDDLHDYFTGLAAKAELPDLSSLLGDAMLLVDRYATTRITESEPPWVAPKSSNPAPPDDDDLPGLDDIDTPVIPPKAPDDAPKFHQEKDGFTGDRVLRNSQIFLQDFGWWIEFARAVPEGDIGRVWNIMKIWIFKFAGSSHSNYVRYLLEVYCMLRYEASTDLRNAILDNWLLNIKGELGKWIPADLHQEHYNKWLEDMVRKHGGEFDDKFYRQTISPNVHFFLQIKEEVETAFDLERRSQTHTSANLDAELHLLLSAFKEEEMHLFRSGRSMGHPLPKDIRAIPMLP